MPRPLLPPRGVFVPSELIYDPLLSSHPLRTWIQLRGLAWGRSETPQLSMAQLQEMLAKSRSTIYGHMALLRSWGALRWRSSENGTLIISFPDGLPSPLAGPESGEPEKPAPSSARIDHHNIRDIEIESPVPDSGLASFHAHDPGGHTSGSPPGSPNPAGSPPEIDSSPVAIYRNLAKIKPNQVQRTEILRQVADNNLWYRSVEHWLSHKWNPKNIPGILDMYKRGGPEHCRVCANRQPESQLETIQKMRVEVKNGE